MPVFAQSRDQSGPQPPCNGEPVPAYSSLGAAPAIQTWEHAAWTAPPCAGWSASGASTLIAAAARFRNPSGAEGLRRRIGAASKLTGLLYWSTTNQRWQPLIVEAHAVTASSGDLRRSDFLPAEIAAGGTLYLRQQDNLLGQAVYQMRIRRASPDHFVIATDNSSQIESFAIPLFRPGQIQSVLFLDHETGDVWRYYSLARISGPGAALLAGHAASLVNRAAALFRYMAGIPADQEPPAQR